MRKMGKMGALELRECDKKAIRVLALVIVVCVGVLCLSGCQKVDLGAYDGVPDDEGTEATESLPTKKFTFTVKTTVTTKPMNEDVNVDLLLSKATSYLNENTLNMTDLWVLDYMGGELVQMVHQTPTDSGWGQPTMQLAYGSHHVIASRGVTPVLDTDAHTITWGSVRDTFAKDYEVNVVNTSNGNRAVTLERVVTKMKVTGVDVVPASCATISVTPATWYMGYDYVNDAAIAPASNQTISVSVPSTYVGTSGQLSLGVFSISGTDEWNASVVVRTATSEDVTLGHATIASAPFLRNRSTEYSGNLFSSGGSMSVSIIDDWATPFEGTW